MPQRVMSLVEQNYFSRRGPIVQHGVRDKTFKFGTRDFVCEERNGRLVAMDVPLVNYSRTVGESLPEQTTYIPLDDYLDKYEEEERRRCRGVNLELINDLEDSEEDDMCDVADEIEEEN